jgi:histidinol dehydrogenase
MRICTSPNADERRRLCLRPAIPAADLRANVKAIVDQVRRDGDAALREITRRFDKVELETLAAGPEEFTAAERALSADVRAALETACENIRKFHSACLPKPIKIETMPGVSCWNRFVPIPAVGLYVPGGRYPLFSSVLMLAVPANLAGCSEIIMCTPPGPDGHPHPAMLFAARLAGVTQVFKIGGAQAIAAMAYGTESVPRVDKIFGPGNQYVTAAKQLVSLETTAIDLPAGPSEALVIADSSAEPAFVAADLLSQAEHGPDSQVVLVTTDSILAERVNRLLEAELREEPAALASSLSASAIVIVRDLKEAADFSNEYAPEHLVLAVADPVKLSERIQNAGSVFLGHYAPVAAGDYASGTNHTLPTAGFARAYSGVSTASFLKQVTFQELSRAGLEKLGPVVATLASAEGMRQHAHAVSVRLKKR